MLAIEQPRHHMLPALADMGHMNQEMHHIEDNCITLDEMQYSTHCWNRLRKVTPGHLNVKKLVTLTTWSVAKGVNQQLRTAFQNSVSNWAGKKFESMSLGVIDQEIGTCKEFLMILSSEAAQVTG